MSRELQLLTRRDLLQAGAAGALGATLVGAAPQRATASPSTGAKRCVLLFAAGGPSHLDTWDPKPDAPSEIRGPFRAISTNVPGVQFCEHLPLMAGMADKLTLIRSMSTGETGHEAGSRLMLSTLMSSLELTSQTEGSTGPMPAHVSLGQSLRGMPMELPVLPATQNGGLIGQVQQARRCLEQGARLVTLHQGGWDTHGNAFSTLKDDLLPELDLAFSMLLRDLSDRGLLEETLVVWMGEFGRTPTINRWGGRDHHADSFSVVMAGGNLANLRVFGESDAEGRYSKHDPVTLAELASLCQVGVLPG